MWHHSKHESNGELEVDLLIFLFASYHLDFEIK